jgi:hypothetical protein
VDARQDRLQKVAIEAGRRKLIGGAGPEQRKSQAGQKPASSADPIVPRALRHQ